MSKCSTCLKMSRYGYCDNLSSMDIGDRNPCVDGSMYEPRLFTNADRIRGMNDEEMANMLYSFEDLKMPNYCQRKKECDDMLDADIDIPAGKCIRCLLDWLRQPAEEASDGQTV